MPGLTTHSTVRAISLPLKFNIDCSPVNSGARQLRDYDRKRREPIGSLVAPQKSNLMTIRFISKLDKSVAFPARPASTRTLADVNKKPAIVVMFRRVLANQESVTFK